MEQNQQQQLSLSTEEVAFAYILFRLYDRFGESSNMANHITAARVEMQEALSQPLVLSAEDAKRMVKTIKELATHFGTIPEFKEPMSSRKMWIALNDLAVLTLFGSTKDVISLNWYTISQILEIAAIAVFRAVLDSDFSQAYVVVTWCKSYFKCTRRSPPTPSLEQWISNSGGWTSLFELSTVTSSQTPQQQQQQQTPQNQASCSDWEDNVYLLENPLTNCQCGELKRRGRGRFEKCSLCLSIYWCLIGKCCYEAANPYYLKMHQYIEHQEPWRMPVSTFPNPDSEEQPWEMDKH